MNNYVIYIRVSTQKQGASGLGLEAQMTICQEYINQVNGQLVNTFKDVESGKSRTRQGLWSAITFCKENNCTLVIAKLDRLARDVEFTFKVINSGVQIHFCDMPQVNTMILGVFASVAQYERELISARTKAALGVRKKQLAEDGYFITKEGKRCEKLGGGTMEQAVKKASELRQEKARQNQANLFLIKYIDNFEKRNGELNGKTDRKVWEDLAEELNNLGQTTSKGLPFNYVRLYAMVKRVKKY
jgi:DNA invertase Pin-like site-specific DNA recombinase